MNIYEKSLAMMNEVQYLAKDDHVSFGSTSYKALSEEKVTSVMRQKLVKYKLIVYPIAQTASRDKTITHVDVIYRMQDTEDPSQYIDIASCGDGADTQDKGSGKAMTYAFKYMWLRTFALPTGEDPDKISSAELDEKERNPVCGRCGAMIAPVKKRSGETWQPKDMAKYAQSRYGMPLCGDCMRAAKKEHENGTG